MSDQDNDKRHFSRILFDCAVTIIDANHTVHWPATLIDVSLKGALVSRPESWRGQTGDRYMLEIKLNKNDTIITMEVVEVAHIEDHEIGFVCHDIDIDSITHLRRLVELNLGDADMIDRELAALGQTDGS